MSFIGLYKKRIKNKTNYETKEHSMSVKASFPSFLSLWRRKQHKVNEIELNLLQWKTSTKQIVMNNSIHKHKIEICWGRKLGI